MGARWRLLTVVGLGLLFLGSLYLGFTLQGRSEENELAPELFVAQLNAGAFLTLEQAGEQVRGQSASGDYFVTMLPAGNTLHERLLLAGADETIVQDILTTPSSRPLGERLASQLLWIGPALLLLSLLLIIWRGQNLPVKR